LRVGLDVRSEDSGLAPPPRGDGQQGAVSLKNL
jgi:hypothetical protein